MSAHICLFLQCTNPAVACGPLNFDVPGGPYITFACGEHVSELTSIHPIDAPVGTEGEQP